MFPTLQYQLCGLDPDKKYNVFVDIIQMDSNTWKFQGNRWMSCGTSSSSSSASSNNSKQNSLFSSSTSLSPPTSSNQHRIYLHPDSPNTGAHWMKNEIAFGKIKLTNNRSSPAEGHIILKSMHRYLPRLHVVLQDDAKSVKTFTFDETHFIAVTAYQNADVLFLKIIF